VTKVAVSGAGGSMGRLVAATVSAADDLELGALYDAYHNGEEILEGTITDDPMKVAGADIVVEFTEPRAVMGNLRRWQEYGVHAVVGTSGFTEFRFEELRKFWGAGPPNCLVAPNFSIGAVLLMRFAEMAAPHFAAAEVIELHHDRKADAPSGTALATAKRMRDAGSPGDRAVVAEELEAGARGANLDGINVHAVRLPGLLAHQEVILGDAGQTLTLRHDSSDRVSFMPGVLLAVRAIEDLPGVTVGIDGLLGL
jgi:4-hydroxy-tetrahydrodipicolinate reductase